MASGLLGIATSGLTAFQRSLTTTGHNISNVNTEGYSRQRVDLTERPPQFTGAGFLGNGVDIASVTRSYDNFLNNQVRISTSTHAELDVYHSMSAQVDNILADKDAGLSSSLQAFFNAVQGVANDPTSIAARRVMLTEGETLAKRFNTLDSRMNELRGQTNQGLAESVDEMNNLASGIAALNERIVVALGQSGGKQPPNDLLDQRNLLLEKLSKQVDTRAIELDDGSLSVFIGTGQTLVMGSYASSLKLQDSAYDPNRKDIALSVGGSGSVVITDNLSGGQVDGLLNFASRVLDPTQNDLGRIAAGLAVQFNAQHRLGYGLDGDTGLDFFAAPSVSVLGRSGNAGVITASFADVNQLTASDYRIDRSAGGAVVTDLHTNTVTTYTSATFTHEGLAFDVSAAAVGDSFLVQPTRRVAGELTLTLTDSRQIAASASDTATGTVGDNGNVRALAALQTGRNLLNGKASYQDAYSAIVGDVGSLTKAAEVNSTAQKNLLDHAIQARDSVSGVNLDEEAANLIKFQQSYQAAAQLITVVNSTFDALIGAIRR
jgi:flagellar hook-associated protein 1 FlgK